MIHGRPSPCEAVWLGRVAYGEGLAMQEHSVAERVAGEAADRLYLLEHPHVYTLGRAADRANVIVSEGDLAAAGAALYHTGRGGDVTYHGPGQLVGYPVISLKPDRCDVHRYVRDLEETLIRTVAGYGIRGERSPGFTGVWVDGEKIAAIGVRIARWVTSHGFALNVSTELERFEAIVPCGISDRGVTSIERVTGRRVPLDEIAEAVAGHFGDVFERAIDYRTTVGGDYATRP